MANMTTSLVEFSDIGNTRTSTAPSHTVAAPRLVIQTRKLPSGVDGVASTSIRVVFGTSNSVGPIASRISFEGIVRTPVDGSAADVASALALFREIIASDNFGSVVNTQNWL